MSVLKKCQIVSEPIHIISLGAGVQSSTMALMAAKGEIEPMPTVAVFADVKNSEPPSVAKWLDFLKTKLPFPVAVVSKGSLYEDLLKSAQDRSERAASIPAHTVNRNGDDGMLWRQCTSEYKVEPLQKFIKEYRRERSAVVWMGISLDEVRRMKDSNRDGVINRYPLVEKRMDRDACLRWMANNGFPKPPRSACFFCPYHSDSEWRRLKDEEPESFDAAAKLDVILRRGFGKTSATLFLHPSRKPLFEVDFSTEEERGQLNMFNNECEGMCGV